MRGMSYSSDLTDDQWALLEPVFKAPGERDRKHADDLRTVVDAVLYMAHTGCQWLPFTTDDGWLSWVQGYVGSGVTGVTVHPPVGPDVEATVADGRFAAWWPSNPPSSKHSAAMGAWTCTVTLADGSTRRVTG